MVGVWAPPGEHQVARVASPGQSLTGHPVCIAQQHVQRKQPVLSTQSAIRPKATASMLPLGKLCLQSIQICLADELAEAEDCYSYCPEHLRGERKQNAGSAGL